MPQDAVVRSFVIGHNAQEATEAVENKGAEVGGKRHGEQRVRQLGQSVVRQVAPTGEDAVRQSGDGRVGGRAGVTKHKRDGDDADDR